MHAGPEVVLCRLAASPWPPKPSFVSCLFAFSIILISSFFSGNPKQVEDGMNDSRGRTGFACPSRPLWKEWAGEMATLGSCPPPVEEMGAQRGFMAMHREAQIWHVALCGPAIQPGNPQTDGGNVEVEKGGPTPHSSCLEAGTGEFGSKCPQGSLVPP